jgi:hypothetical protein
MAPVGAAGACMRYLGPNTVGCVVSQGDPAVVNLGIPFESIDAAPERALVMRRVLTAFGLL